MKKYLYLLIIAFSFVFNYNYVTAININDAKEYELEQKEFELSAKNAILYNLTDNFILYDKDSNEEVQIASLTKIMTAIVAIENINNLDEKITIKKEVFNNLEEYAQAGFKIGQETTYRDLLYGVLLPSGADAVNALILNVTEKKEEFIKLMNDKAQELGLEHTKFDNGIGMDSENNYSTAHDLAVLLNYAITNKEFYKIFTTKNYNIESLNLKLESTLLHYGKNIDTSIIKGAKSGFTDEAGVCLASITSKDNIDYLLIILGASGNDRANAIKDTIKLYDYYTKNFSHKIVTKENQELKKIDIKWGKKKTYSIKSKKEISLYLNNDIDLNDIKKEYTGIEELNYKIKKGTKLGNVTLKYNNIVLNSSDVYLDEDISYYHPIIYTIIGVIIFFMTIVFIKKKKKKKRRRKKRR